MARIDAGRAAQVGGFVFRYLWSRHRGSGRSTNPAAADNSRRTGCARVRRHRRRAV